MSRIANAFSNKKAFLGFLTAGDPNLEKSKEFILTMIDAGADLIEIGIPFSDPIAEGPVIQEANIRALKAGTTVDKIFAMVAELRTQTEVPFVFLTYLNPVFHYGYDAFMKRCQETGVDGLIIPDLPYEEQGELLPYAKQYEVDLITLIAPTSEQRIQTLSKEASGFLYVVSSMGVTGVRSEIRTDLAAIIDKIKQYATVPVAVGFGISSPEQAEAIGAISDGVIVGSAIVKIIETYQKDAAKPLYEYVKGMKTALTKCC